MPSCAPRLSIDFHPGHVLIQLYMNTCSIVRIYILYSTCYIYVHWSVSPVVISSIHHFHLAAAAAPLPLGILLSTPESMSAMWVRRSCTPLATRWSTSLSYRSYSAGSVIVPSTTARTEQTEPADEDRQTDTRRRSVSPAAHEEVYINGSAASAGRYIYYTNRGRGASGS